MRSREILNKNSADSKTCSLRARCKHASRTAQKKGPVSFDVPLQECPSPSNSSGRAPSPTQPPRKQCTVRQEPGNPFPQEDPMQETEVQWQPQRQNDCDHGYSTAVTKETQRRLPWRQNGCSHSDRTSGNHGNRTAVTKGTLVVTMATARR